MTAENRKNAIIGMIAIGALSVAFGLYESWTAPKHRLADDISEAYVGGKCGYTGWLNDDGSWKKCIHDANIMDPFSPSNNSGPRSEEYLSRAERTVTRICGPKSDTDAWKNCVQETAMTVADNMSKYAFAEARAVTNHDQATLDALDKKVWLEDTPTPNTKPQSPLPSEPSSRVEAIASSQTSSAISDAGTYANAKYSYSVSYSSALLTALPEPDAGDGTTFKAKDGSGEISVYGEYNVSNHSLDDLANDAEKECPSGKAAYRLVNSYMTATSCDKAGQVLYQVTVMKNDRLVTIRAEYPAADRAQWNNIISRMNTSLHLADDKPLPSANQ